jgi:hypothetical protein
MSTGTPSRSVWTTNSNRTGGRLSGESEGPNGKSEGSGSVDNSEDHALEHPTPVSAADPLPAANEDTQRSPDGSSPRKGVETTPKKKGGDLAPSLKESLPEGWHTGEDISILHSHPHLSFANTATPAGNESDNHTDGCLVDNQTAIGH